MKTIWAVALCVALALAGAAATVQMDDDPEETSELEWTTSTGNANANTVLTAYMPVRALRQCPAFDPASSELPKSLQQIIDIAFAEFEKHGGKRAGWVCTRIDLLQARLFNSHPELRGKWFYLVELRGPFKNPGVLQFPVTLDGRPGVIKPPPAASESGPPLYERNMKVFLAAIDKAKTIQFEMTVTSVRTSGPARGPTAWRYRVSVSRPDRLAVVPLTPETAQFGLACDGEELLCYAPGSRQYCLVDAPDTLLGIYDLVFKQALRDLGLQWTLAPFIENPYSWQNREPCQVREGEPLGEAEYAGVPCEMFLGRQIVAYFEKDKRGLYRGQQMFYGGWRQTASGQMVGDPPRSVSIDKWTLDGDISASEFSVKPPAGYERVKDLAALPADPVDGGRAAMAGPAADLPASAAPAEIRRRALTLYTTGYDNSPVTGQLFQRAADLGDPLAVMWVARLEQQGRAGLRADAAGADGLARTVAGEVKRLAETANPEAQFLWGMTYLTGLGVSANPSEGLRWLLDAAEKGDTLAMSNVGTLLETGQAGPRDAAKGFEWTEKAARQGNGLAISNIGLSYQWGSGVAPDRAKALAWHLRALCLGYDHAGDVELLTREARKHRFSADAIRPMPYVKLFGTYVADLPKVAAAAGIAPADAVLLPPAPGARSPLYSYKKHGMSFLARFGRVWTVELYAEGVKGFDQFAGQLPLGLQWDDTRDSAGKKLGRPDWQGDVADDAAYEMAYNVDNLILGVSFSPDPPGHIKLVRIVGRWASNPPRAAGFAAEQ